MLFQWKEYLAKYFTNLISIFSLVAVVFMSWHLFTEEKRIEKERLRLEERWGKLIGLEDAGKQLSDSVAQLKTVYQSQEKLSKSVLAVWKDVRLERGERVKSQKTSIVTIEEKVSLQEGPDYQFKTEGSTKGFIVNELRINGPDSPPIGYVLIEDDGKTYKKNYKFGIQVESVELKDDLTGKVRVVSRAFLIPQENGLAEKRRPDFKKWKGERYLLPVTGGELLVDPVEPLVVQNRSKKFIPYVLNLNTGIGVLSSKEKIINTSLGLDTNLAGYGYSKQDLDWKVFHLGLNYNDSSGLGLYVLPLTYRPFPSIFTNTYIGPGYFVTGSGSKGLTFQVNVGL